MPSVSREATPENCPGNPRGTNPGGLITPPPPRKPRENCCNPWRNCLLVTNYFLTYGRKIKIPNKQKGKKKHAFRSFFCISFIYLAVRIRPIRNSHCIRFPATTRGFQPDQLVAMEIVVCSLKTLACKYSRPHRL